MEDKVTAETVRTWYVLTIKQPWASSIFWSSSAGTPGRKDVENRTWTRKYRGPLIIHAGAAFDKEAVSAARPLYTGEAVARAYATRDETKRILGIVNLVDIVENADSPWAQPGQKHWLLAEPKLLAKPIEDVVGKLGLWHPDEDLARSIAQQLR